MVKKNSENRAFKIIGLVLILALTIFIAWKLSGVLILVLTGIMLAATLAPAVKWMQKFLPLRLAAALVIILLVLPIILAIFFIVPTFIDQVDAIARAINQIIYSNQFLPKLFHNIDISQYTSQAGQYLVASTALITSFITQLIILIFLTYYLLIDSKTVYQLFSLLIPKSDRKRADKAVEQLAHISGHYIRGNIFISLVCGLCIFSGLFLLHVPGAAPLAIFAAITDLLPLIGATLGAIPAVILAFSVSPLIGFLTIILFIVYQLLESDVLAPVIYHKALKLIPFLTFVSVIIGATLFGITGAFLALPIAASIPTIIHYFHKDGEYFIKALSSSKK